MENLGQVEHIFCDKTGVLTSGKTSFEYLNIGKSLLGDGAISL
jgi:magnesium-transporting ATPase (P-type)